MTDLSVQRHVDAPADRVWAIITDLETATRVMTALDSVGHVEGPFPRIGVGTVWDETRTMMGRSETQRMRCSAIDEDTMRYTVEADAHGAHYESVLAVEAQPGGCVVSMSFGAEPTTTMSRVLSATIGRLFVRSTRKALQADLDDIAQAAAA